MLLSERALKLTLYFKGLNKPGKQPNGAPGITLGYGYDLGHVTAADARHMLVSESLPMYAALTRRAFRGSSPCPRRAGRPAVARLQPGVRMTDSPGTDDREEMRAIRDLMARGMVAGGIVEQIRAIST